MKKIIFIWLIPKIVGVPYGINLLSKGHAENLCHALNQYFENNGMQWNVVLDDTSADIEALSQQNADMFLIVPGGKIRFYLHRKSLMKSNAYLYYLDSMEYSSNNINKIIHTIKNLDNKEGED